MFSLLFFFAFLINLFHVSTASCLYCLESAKQRWALLGEFWLRTWILSQVWSEPQTHCASLLHSKTRKKIKNKTQICFKWHCRIHEISVFTAFSSLILESRSISEDVDEIPQEQQFVQHTN